jgi:hypothetical protein
MKRQILIAVMLLLALFAKSQDTSSYSLPVAPPTDTIPIDIVSVGVGGGYEFGGLGGNIIYYPTRGLGVFFGAGYTLIGFGYNAGVKIRIVTDESADKFMPYIIAMYGYNATINYPSFPQRNMTFYGLSVGAGMDYRPGNSQFGYLSATIYVPIRSTGVKDYINNEGYFYGIPYASSRIFPLSASIGYKFIFKRDKTVGHKMTSL